MDKKCFLYFNPSGDSPSIYDVISFEEHPGMKVILRIESEQENQIEVTFEAMKNRVDGMKVIQEDRQKLKVFWGSHGDEKIYKITVKCLLKGDKDV